LRLLIKGPKDIPAVKKLAGIKIENCEQRRVR
jgi:hypothetical protein